ncbi:MAG: glycoside hydrolase family 97 N-terminal domain-containing protein, partial [Acidobacteriota bacterium]|nr:glycoside hydrolase family 97 N-terminal domain-containing protein [Acidobacteriota bacterium]
MRLKMFILFVWLFSLNAAAQNIESPDRKLSLSFGLTNDGEPTYQLSLGGKPVVRQSKLGIELKDLPAFNKGFTVLKADTSEKDETWEPVWGEVKQVRNHYRELAITLQQASADNRRI